MIKGIYHTEIDMEISFHDADMMEVVWHGYYAKYFEIARCVIAVIQNFAAPSE